MKQVKLAFTSTTQVDTLTFLSALKSVNERLGEVVDARFWFAADFGKTAATHAGFDEFLKFAQTAHVALVHLMGEPPKFDVLVSSLKNAGVPVFISGSFFDQNFNYRRLSTAEPEDYQKIFVYLNHGGKSNFENLLLYLANRFVGAAYDVNAPVPAKWEGIYHPDFDYVPTLEEYLEKKVDPNRLTVGRLVSSRLLAGQ
jgi:cobaltochelatase CobN